MNRDIVDINDNVNANTFDVERIKRALPEFFDREGNFLMEKLHDTLNADEVSFNNEGYSLDFVGKSYASYLTSTDTETVIVPDTEHNNSEENKDSENLYIIGDNLHALKHLRKSYARNIECIYIDPPYNTGKDNFAYNDIFEITDQDLIEKVGLSEEEAERTLRLHGKASHSAWLSFMLPRLKLAKDLLTDDGLLFISIDENELSNLTLLCNSIYGEENLVSTLIWKNKKGGGNDSDYIAVEHEYILMYARRLDRLPKLFMPYTEEYLKRYKEEDEIGKFYWDTFRRSAGKQFYPITAPDGTVIEKDEYGNPISWLRKEGTFLQNLEDGEARFVRNKDSWSIQFKQRLPQGKKPRSILDNVGTTSTGTSDVEGLFNAVVFDNPKPVDLIQNLIQFQDNPDATVMDFFSGSGTTAHAVLSANAADNGNRNYILVQLPELFDPEEKSIPGRTAYRLGYRSLDHLAIDRITRAANKIKEEAGTEIDYGFKLFRLEEPSTPSLRSIEEFNPENELFLTTDDYLYQLASDNATGEQIVLTTWMNQDNYTLAPKVTRYTLDSYELPVSGKTAYIVKPGFTNSDLVKLVEKLERNEVLIQRLVYLPYTVEFHIKTALINNLKQLKSDKTIDIIGRR